MKTSKRLLAGTLVGLSLISLSGCSTSMLADDPTSYPLVPELTVNEVVEYYAEALSFDAIITKNLDVETVKYETHEVTDPVMQEKLKQAIALTQQVLGRMTYEYSDATDISVSEETFHYIKTYLNDRQLNNGQIIKMEQALGYYFIDATYDISARSLGTFKPQSSLLGLNGAFLYSDYEQTDYIDTAFLTQAATKLNEYYKENRISDKRASFNASTGVFSTSLEGAESILDFTSSAMNEIGLGLSTTTDIGQPDISQPIDDEQLLNGEQTLDGEQTTTEEASTEGLNDIWQAVDSEIDTTTDEEIEDFNETLNTDTGIIIRSPQIDISEFNTVVGSSKKRTAYMPALDLVYSIPESEGSIGGIGLYPSGAGGLAKFGVKRSELAGTVTLRFVYKTDLTNPDIIRNINIYPIFSEITTGFSSNNDSVVPEFLMTEFEKLIERADRALVNNDISALMSGNIFADMGMAVLRGYESQYVNVLRQISTIRRVINRDVNDSAYLLEIESQRQEGPKGADVYGTYRDIIYAVVEQRGQEFVITDWMNMTRKMQIEPEINPDSAVAKRIVSLNLAGEVEDTVRTEVSDFLDVWYTACNARVLNGPKEKQTASGTQLIERGMYDCFNDDPEMLSSTKLEDINSKARGILVKHGTAVESDISGTITEWIGGADNQVEFMTEELVSYQGRSDGVYMQCYYLVSKMYDTWVIDDLQVIVQEEVSGTSMTEIANRIKSAQ